MIYELREYVAHDGTIQQVHDRFAAATLPLFERHGIDVVGFWVDAEEPQRLVYLLQFENAETQRRAWAEFQKDEDWKRAKADSEAAGPIVARMTSRTLHPVSYWPTVPSTDGEGRQRS